MIVESPMIGDIIRVIVVVLLKDVVVLMSPITANRSACAPRLEKRDGSKKDDLPTDDHSGEGGMQFDPMSTQFASGTRFARTAAKVEVRSCPSRQSTEPSDLIPRGMLCSHEVTLEDPTGSAFNCLTAIFDGRDHWVHAFA